MLCWTAKALSWGLSAACVAHFITAQFGFAALIFVTDVALTVAFYDDFMGDR